MSREQDKAKAKELHKKYSMKKAEKDLAKSRKDAKFIRNLNKNTKRPTNYSETLELALYLSEQLGMKKELKFIKTLRDGDDSVFINLPKKKQQRLMDIMVSIENVIKKREKAVQVRAEKKDTILIGIRAYLKDIIDEIDSNLSKKDYPTGWECALDIRKMYAKGELPGDVDSITDANKWGVKHCTVKGKEIPRYTKLAKDYENAKFGRTKSGKVIDAFEEKYYDKIN